MKRSLQPPPEPTAAEAETRARPRSAARLLGVGAVTTAVGAVVVLAAATTVAVHASTNPADDPASAPIAAESTDADAPEKAAAKGESVPPPAAIASAYGQMAGDEVAYIRYLISLTGDYAGGIDLYGDPGLQFISADVAEPAAYSDGQRRLSSFYYDYGTDELVSFVVNVTTGSVEDAVRGSGAQPAPTDAETAHAWELLLADEAADADLGAEYADFTGGAALTPETAGIELTAHSFSSDAGSFGAESCGIERCVQILAQVDGGPYLTTSTYVVNLSTKTVLPVK